MNKIDETLKNQISILEIQVRELIKSNKSLRQQMGRLESHRDRLIKLLEFYVDAETIAVVKAELGVGRDVQP